MRSSDDKTYLPEWWLCRREPGDELDWSSDDLASNYAQTLVESFLGDNDDQDILTDNTDEATQYLIMLLLMKDGAEYRPTMRLATEIAQLRVSQSIRNTLCEIQNTLRAIHDCISDDVEEEDWEDWEW